MFTAVALIAWARLVSTIPRLILAVGSTFVSLAAVVGLVLTVLSRRTLLVLRRCLPRHGHPSRSRCPDTTCHTPRPRPARRLPGARC